jgi:hypothetical protein
LIQRVAQLLSCLLRSFAKLTLTLSFGLDGGSRHSTHEIYVSILKVRSLNPYVRGVKLGAFVCLIGLYTASDLSTLRDIIEYFLWFGFWNRLFSAVKSFTDNITLLPTGRNIGKHVAREFRIASALAVFE